MISKEEKRLWKLLYKKCMANRQKEDTLQFPLTEHMRRMCTEEGYDEYGFLDFEGDWSDSEIDRWFDSNMKRRIPSNIYWDCSGCYFTQWITWHRNPNGMVSFVHSVAIDV